MADELNPDERKAWAHSLYKREDLSYKDIALEVGTDEATVRMWSIEDEWNGTKRSQLTAKRVQLDFLYTCLEKLSEKMKNPDDINPKDIDLMVKYTNAIKNLEIEPSVAEIIEVMEVFIQWLRRRDLQAAQKVVVYLNAFVTEKAEANK